VSPSTATGSYIFPNGTTYVLDNLYIPFNTYFTLSQTSGSGTLNFTSPGTAVVMSSGFSTSSINGIISYTYTAFGNSSSGTLSLTSDTLNDSTGMDGITVTYTNTSISYTKGGATFTWSRLPNKKGFVCGNGDPSGAAKINSLKVGWYYTWGSAPLSPAPTGIKFTPMFWNVSKTPSCTSPTSCPVLTTTLMGPPTDPTQENILLTYNEPDGTDNAAQGDMLVSQAIEFWPSICATNRGRIGSPVMYRNIITPSQCANNKPPYPGYTPSSSSPAVFPVDISNNSTPNIVNLIPGNWDSADNNITGIWLDNFLYQIHLLNQSRSPGNKLRFPDFICVHWYGKPVTTPRNGLLDDTIDPIWNKYHLKIWVTEYSCADWDATCCTPMSSYSRYDEYPEITSGTTHTTGIDWSYPTDDNINTNQTAQFMSATVQGMYSRPYVERFSWKERFLLLPPGTSAPSPTSNYMIESSANPDVMGQSSLFHSFEHFPPASPVPPLLPLGTLYASL